MKPAAIFSATVRETEMIATSPSGSRTVAPLAFAGVDYPCLLVAGAQRGIVKRDIQTFGVAAQKIEICRLGFKSSDMAAGENAGEPANASADVGARIQDERLCHGFVVRFQFETAPQLPLGIILFLEYLLDHAVIGAGAAMAEHALAALREAETKHFHAGTHTVCLGLWPLLLHGVISHDLRSMGRGRSACRIMELYWCHAAQIGAQSQAIADRAERHKRFVDMAREVQASDKPKDFAPAFRAVAQQAVGMSSI